jgi:hypothetical protein
MKKALFLLLCFALVVFAIIFAPSPKKKSITVKKEAPRLFASTQPNVANSAPIKKSLAAPGRQTYSISTTHHSPDFYKAIIDPEDVKVGQSQTMTVYVKDEKAPITEVTADIQTDKEIIKHPLKRISGTDKDGVWESSWLVHDTHDTTYVTIFKAKNSLGETGDARLSWTDPGCGCTGGADCTISTTCTVSGDEGAGGGTLTITGSVTVPNGTYLTYGATLNMSGTLNLNDGGVLKPGSICGGVGAGVACPGADTCQISTRLYNPQCNGSGTCQFASSQDCSAHVCQTGGGCSAGSCLTINNRADNYPDIGCGYYNCNSNGTCRTSCGTDANCSTGRSCVGSVCVSSCWKTFGSCNAACQYNSYVQSCGNNFATGTACSGTGSGLCFARSSYIISGYYDSLGYYIGNCSDLGYGYASGYLAITCSW